MNVRPEARSPFRLLDELDEAREVLVLSYTANLDFFERFALSQARALGAIVTLISDATMVSADPVLTRGAGTAYLDARAVCPSGAFHPKLVVLAGENAARVAIGSGNLTIAGWHGNAEIWTVLRGDRDRAPGTFAEISAFLRRLAVSAVKLTPGAAEALVRVADRLGTLPATEPGPRLVDNLDQPILDQLPKASAQELVCSSPFFDGDLAALKKLMEILSPSSLAVHLQAQTSVEGRALLELLAGRNGDVRWIADERYHHGKLVEWTAGGRRWALTGSPNLSRRALLNPTSAGGNCELALLTEVGASLAPASGEPPVGAAAELLLDREGSDRHPGVLLMGAIRVPGAVRLLLHDRAGQPGRVQRYDAVGDGWRRIATFEPGESVYEIEPSSAPPGQALRVVLDDGAVSNAVFVTDLARVRRPQMSAVGRVRASPQHVAVEGLGTALLADVEELREHLLKAGALVPASPPGSSEESGTEETGDEPSPQARPAPGQTLEDYLAACDPVLGREMTEFALVLPALPGLGPDLGADPQELDTDFEDDEPPPGDEDDPDDVPAPDLTETLRALSDTERSRWQRWVERLVDRSDEYPMVVRTLALRSVLHGVADGIWTDGGWPPILSDAVAALASPGDEATDEELAAAASLGAIALALIRAEVPRLSVRDERMLRFEAAVRDVSPLLPHFDVDRVELLGPGMPERLTEIGVLDACMQVAGEVLEPQNEAEKAVRLLAEEHGFESWLDGGATIVFSEPLPRHAEPRLYLALGLARGEGPVVARGTTEDGTAVLAAWKAPNLVVEWRGRQRWGRMFQLSTGLSPLNYANLDAGRPREVASWAGEEDRPEQAEDLLRPHQH